METNMETKRSFMKTLIFMLLFLPALVFSQTMISEKLFTNLTDTTENYASNDTVDIQLIGFGDGSWHILTDYITAAEKLAETTLEYRLAGESWWTHAPTMKVRIRSAATTITSKPISIGHLDGAITVWIVPDTVLADTHTDYGGSGVTGN